MPKITTRLLPGSGRHSWTVGGFDFHEGVETVIDVPSVEDAIDRFHAACEAMTCWRDQRGVMRSGSEAEAPPGVETYGPASYCVIEVEASEVLPPEPEEAPVAPKTESFAPKKAAKKAKKKAAKADR